MARVYIVEIVSDVSALFGNSTGISVARIFFWHLKKIGAKIHIGILIWYGMVLLLFLINKNDLTLVHISNRLYRRVNII